jgi:DNA topoisomerase I
LAEGLITYHRTDGLDISKERVEGLRKGVASLFPGSHRLSPQVQKFKSKAKNAQEAHEAITIVDPARGPRASQHFSRAEKMLHELIFWRSLACQMESATLRRVRY